MNAYLNPELHHVIAQTPEQRTWDPEGMRAETEVVFAPDSGGLGDAAAEKVRIVMLTVHGGGYVMGSPSFDLPRDQQLEAFIPGLKTIQVEYSLAPEATYPVAVQEVSAAVDKARGQYPQARIVLLGDSAGGGISWQAVAAGAQVDQLILLEPVVDPTMSTPSWEEFSEGPIWNKAASQASWKHYLGDAPLPSYRNFTGTWPPTLVFANAADPLRDEDIDLARWIISTGAPCELHLLAGTFHGALSVPGTTTWQRVHRTITEFLPLH